MCRNDIKHNHPSLQPCNLTAVGKCLEMGDAAVLFATAASIFGAPALLLLIAVRDFRRHARAGSFAPAAPLDRNNGSHPRSTTAAPDAPLEIEHLRPSAEPEQPHELRRQQRHVMTSGAIHLYEVAPP